KSAGLWVGAFCWLFSQPKLSAPMRRRSAGRRCPSASMSPGLRLRLRPPPLLTAVGHPHPTLHGARQTFPPLARRRQRPYGRDWHGGGLAMIRSMAAWLWVSAFGGAPALASDGGERPRVRDAGVVVGSLPTGPLNAIVDVEGV